MREVLTFLAAAIPLGGIIPYLINIVKGKTKPNIVTWLTWSLINGINAAAAFSDGAWQTAAYSTAGFVATASVVAFGLKFGKPKYTKLDITCQVLALCGIPLWLLTSEPALAVILVMIVDFIGGLPTLVHAWKKPFEETLTTFALSGLGGLIVLISLTRFDVVAITMPLYIFLFDSVVIAATLFRRQGVKAHA